MSQITAVDGLMGTTRTIIIDYARAFRFIDQCYRGGMNVLIDWAAAPATRSPREKDTRQIASGQNISVVRITIEPTAKFTGKAHSHIHEQWVVVLAGQVRMIVDNEEVQLGQGDVLYIPINAPHAPLSVGPDGAQYLEIFAPPRMDLLPRSIVPPV